MKFTYLRISNFGAVGWAELRLDNRGLVLVQGENQDDSSSESNGAGKSTIADALSWALYGKTARGASGDKLVNRTAKKDCMVAVQFRDDTTSYIVERYRKHCTQKNSLQFYSMAAGKRGDLTGGTEKLTQTKIEEIIGCSYEVFTAAIYAGQEKMPDLPALTDKPLKVLIEEAAGTTVLERAYDIAKKRAADAAVAVKEAEDAVARARVVEENLKTRKTDAENSANHFENQRNLQVAAKGGSMKELDTERFKIRLALEVLNETDARTGIAELQAKLNAVEGEKETERNAVDALAKLERDHTAKVTAADRTMRSWHTEAMRLKGIVEQHQKAGTQIQGMVGKPCAECDRPFAEGDLVNAKRIQEGHVATALNEFKHAKGEFDKAKAAHNDALEAQRTETEKLRQALEDHRAGMTDVSEVSRQLALLNARIAQIEGYKAQISTINGELLRLQKERDALKAAPNPHELMVRQLTLEIVKAQDAVREKLDEQWRAEQDRDLADAALKVFSPAGVRAEILDTVTPYLNARTAHYLGTLSDGNISAVWSTLTRTAKGELKEKFCIEVEDKVGGESFTDLSGGEKRKVRLACALALQDLVATRASKPIDLFIGDEIDYALDEPGLERLMMVLEEKARERGTVIVISHSDLKDWIRNTITVSKKDGQATIKEAA